ncbi:acetyl-CoA carboxylase, carboxyl transferase, alpha subunit [gamma proteobacterium HTCC5015]|nr:acetyl-CoA carboxylase, carboxyl transferase, alpha subunit [gamma proteobacterium HTCC5015]
MDPNYLDFEQDIAELDTRIARLRRSTDAEAGLDVRAEVKQLEQKRQQTLESTFGKLSSWQVCQLARHPMRPHTLDYIERLFTDFEPLHGDRMFADDTAIVGGLARLGGRPVMVIGHEKGRDTKDKLRCNFGMPRPEGYRKAQRLARMAERFELPVLTFIDTPGAYPGIDAEARGQSEAIAQSLMLFAGLRTPVLSIVIGEGGSGGALAIGVGDHLAMLEHSIYSVISPEGCASILWKSAERASEAAEAMGVIAPKLLELGLIDELVREPLGGAQRDIEATAASIQSMFESQLDRLLHCDIDQLLEQRYQRLRAYGAA